MSQPHRKALLLLGVLALIAYSNSFAGGMVFDNALAIRQDARVHAATAENIHLILTEEYWYKTSVTGLFRPLTTLSYLFNYAVLGNGPDPAGYHVVNLLLHLANMCLLYVLALRIAGDAALAFALAAIWGLHPLLTDSVTNIVGRADLLAALGVLGGLAAHLAAARATGLRRLAWLGALLIAATIAIFSKEEGAVLPGVLLLYDLAWWKPAARRARAVGYAMLVLPFGSYFLMRSQVLAREPAGLVPFTDNPLAFADFGSAKLTAIQVIGKYLELFVWPARLSADYSYAAVPLFGWRIADVVEVALCLALAALAVICWRRSRPLSFGLLFFFVTLAPVANVFLPIGSIMAERFLYLPSMGLAVAAVAAISALCRRFATPRVAWVAIGLACAALAARTWARNPDWRDERSLWTSTVETCPHSVKAHWFLADLLIRGDPSHYDRAVAEAERAVAIVDPLPDERNSPRPFGIAGICYRVKGDSLPSPAGAEWYRKALPMLERSARIDALERRQTRQLNLQHGKRVEGSGWIPVYLELGRVYQRLGEPQKALEPLAFGRAQGGGPEFTVELSRALHASGQWERGAVVLIEELVGASQPQLLAELVALYRNVVPAGCAVRGTGDAAQINMDCPLVHGHVCRASQELAGQFRLNGQSAKAETVARSAVQDLACPAEMFR